MKLLLVAALTALAPIAVAEPVAGDLAPGAPFEPRGEPFLLEKCSVSDCPCNGVQGQFCTNGVNPGCIKGHVYECQAGTGKTCDYGYRKSCEQCGQLSC